MRVREGRDRERTIYGEEQISVMEAAAFARGTPTATP